MANLTYRDVKAEILRRIRTDIWPPGKLLPGEVDIATEMGCARATVNRAMRELSDEGVIDRRRKAGTRVNTAPTRQVKFQIPVVRREIEATGAEYRYALASQDIVPAPDWLRARLALKPDTRLLHLECMHYSNGQPFQFEDRWINLSTVPSAEEVDWSVEMPNEWLIRTLPFTDAELRFSATSADEKLSRFLLVPPAAPIFTIERSTWLDLDAVTTARLFFGSGYQMVARY
ncbi:GntR family transcriptional regulator [Ponticoccus alexandrii]|uniref:UTRA domain-containing protein n=1 Tax=Ponticoccus alexandrii TaxID=1943633 RepID=A0ABX7FEV2_9RHOB|nr:GntR family transcriptional regulator [Ponticoccus alexandrii]ETA50578.1 GntR family transcriptional regulator [Rhodobacteraceae bacterium PD-2]QRF68651.1 UTRA domain-containing protein [Ponticoccus alexandrii]